MNEKTIEKMAEHVFQTAKKSYTRIGGIEGIDAGIDSLNEKIVNNSWYLQLFGHHSPDEVEEVFLVGTCATTPNVMNVDARFHVPWVFFRLLACSVLLYVASVLLHGFFNNPNLIPAQFVIGAFAVPSTTLCLFFELNILQNVSIYRVVRFVLVGGLISFFYSLFIYMFKSEESSIFWAGPVEELGKLLAMIVIAEGAGRLRSSHLLGIIGLPFDWLVGRGVAQGERYKWKLNGLLFGAAVGVGFAAFETMGYAFMSLLQGGLGAMQEVIFLRGVLSPFTHVVWSAICGGALWSVRGADEWKWKKLFHLRLLLFLGVVSFLHGFWDIACNDPNAKLWFIGIGVASWSIVLLQVHSGIKQIRKHQVMVQAETKASTISCPHCGYVYAYDPDLIGISVQCGSCNKEFIAERNEREG